MSKSLNREVSGKASFDFITIGDKTVPGITSEGTDHVCQGFNNPTARLSLDIHSFIIAST